MISGVPPFDGETNKQILDKIMKGNYSLQCMLFEYHSFGNEGS